MDPTSIAIICKNITPPALDLAGLFAVATGAYIVVTARADTRSATHWCLLAVLGCVLSAAASSAFTIIGWRTLYIFNGVAMHIAPLLFWRVLGRCTYGVFLSVLVHSIVLRIGLGPGNTASKRVAETTTASASGVTR
jgi:hypothetical protein